jgi:hypothetical protein
MSPKKVIRKEKVSINVYMTEDEKYIYRVVEAATCGTKNEYPAMCCFDSGFFTTKKALNKFLLNNDDVIEIVKDYRKD